MFDHDTENRRRLVRHTVYEPCRAVVSGKEFEGMVVNMSVGGAAVRLDQLPEVQPPPGTPVALYLESIGRIPADVVRSLDDGIAVEFPIAGGHGQQLIAALKTVLDRHPTANA